MCTAYVCRFIKEIRLQNTIEIFTIIGIHFPTAFEHISAEVCFTVKKFTPASFLAAPTLPIYRLFCCWSWDQPVSSTFHIDAGLGTIFIASVSFAK